MIDLNTFKQTLIKNEITDLFEEQIIKRRDQQNEEAGVFFITFLCILSHNLDVEDKRAESLNNDNKALNIKLKEKVFNVILCFLLIETIAIIFIAILQGFRWRGFYLEEWSFRILTGVTIYQITTMLKYVVQYLFPKK